MGTTIVRDEQCLHYDDEVTKKMERCPFCGNSLCLTVEREPFHADIRYHAMATCAICITVVQHDYSVLPEHADIGYIRDMMIQNVNQAIRNTKASDDYKRYLADRAEYMKKYGKEMGVWYGICSDYLFNGKSEQSNDPHDIMENRRDRIFRKSDVKKYLDNKYWEYERAILIMESKFDYTRYKVEYAKMKGKGNMPFPCQFCAQNTLVEANYNECGQVINFGVEGGIPKTCAGGLTHPTSAWECKGFNPKALPEDYVRKYPKKTIQFLSREYMMEVLTTIRFAGKITKSKLIDRSSIGYHTREERINELMEMGYIDITYNVQNEEVVQLTFMGNMVTNAVCELYDAVIEVKEKGDPMEGDAIQVFEYIRGHPKITERQLYEYFDPLIPVQNENLGVVPVDIILDSMVSAGYVDPQYTEDLRDITYEVTDRGLRRWMRVKSENKECSIVSNVVKNTP